MTKPLPIYVQAEPNSIVLDLDATAPGDTQFVTVPAKQNVYVVASGNPTTGYTWKLTNNTCGTGLQEVSSMVYK